MKRQRGVMSPPPNDDPPRGVMEPGACPNIDHVRAIRALLWAVAAGLGLFELVLLNTPGV